MMAAVLIAPATSNTKATTMMTASTVEKLLHRPVLGVVRASLTGEPPPVLLQSGPSHGSSQSSTSQSQSEPSHSQSSPSHGGSGQSEPSHSQSSLSQGTSHRRGSGLGPSQGSGAGQVIGGVELSHGSRTFMMTVWLAVVSVAWAGGDKKSGRSTPASRPTTISFFITLKVLPIFSPSLRNAISISVKTQGVKVSR